MVCLYKAQYPVRWTAQSALHVTPWQTCSFRHQLDFSGKHSSHAAITSEDYSLTFPPLSISRYSFIQLSELGHRGENENAQTSKRYQREDSNPALSITSPACYRRVTALHNKKRRELPDFGVPLKLPARSDDAFLPLPRPILTSLRVVLTFR